MTARQVVVGVTAWVLAVGSVASLSWVAINSAGHEVVRHGGLPRNAGPRALPSPAPAPAPPAIPSAPTASPSVTKVTTAAAAGAQESTATRITSTPTETTQRNRVSRTVGRPDATTRRQRWSRETDGYHVEQTEAAPGTGDLRFVPTGGPLGDQSGDQGSDEFERWLQSVAPAGGFESISVSFVPWWYGRTGGNWNTDSGSTRLALTAGGTGAVDPGRSTRSLTLDGGLVSLSCDGPRLQEWWASPQDGWTLRVARQRGYLQARFRSGEGTVDVQAGCVDSRPAFRYRERAAGSPTGGDWQASVT